MEDLAALIDSYRDGEMATIDGRHVRRWLNQFEANDRDFVLSETLALLRQSFLSPEAVEGRLTELLGRVAPLTPAQRAHWEATSLLSGQRQSESQDFMVRLAQDLLCRGIGYRPEVGDAGQVLIYLDDISGTGNQMSEELLPLLGALTSPRAIKILHLVSHKADYAARKNIEDAAQSHGHSVTFHDSIRVENRKTYSANSHVLYPRAISGGGYTARWAAQFSEEQKRAILRTGPGKGLFTSSDGRDRYEAIMLEKGAYIQSLPRNPVFVMKPLGYKTYPGFGFGMLYATSRNCPNNCPLAWWWGDTSGTRQTLREWYPLMERRVRRGDD